MRVARLFWVTLACLMRSASTFVLAGGGNFRTRREITAAITPPSMFYEEAYGFLSDAARRIERLERSMIQDCYSSISDELDLEERGADLEERGALTLQNRVRPSLHAGVLSVSDNEEDGYTVTLRTADGIDPADVSVSVQGNVLVFSGHIETRDGGAHIRSAFSRSITLPSDVDGDVLTTKYETGKMTVFLPRFTEAAKLSIDDGILEESQSEAERLAAESPRVARWLRAHGYLGSTPGRFGGDGED